MNIENIVKTLISDYFKVEIEKVMDVTTASDIEGWDSLSHTELLLELEGKLDISFELNDLMEMDNVGSLIKIIECK